MFDTCSPVALWGFGIAFAGYAIIAFIWAIKEVIAEYEDHDNEDLDRDGW